MAERGAISLFKGSRRGLSPLIATVLLIAFAVAMGAMIMNWSSNLGDAPGKPDCSGINIVMNPVICYTENMIKLNLRNNGAIVEEMKVKIADDSSESEVALKNSRLRKGDVLERELPYAKKGVASIAITPSINQNGKVVPCDEPAIRLDDIQECTV
jgi:flagellin-like protein